MSALNQPNWGCGVWNYREERTATEAEARALCEQHGLPLDWNQGEPLVALTRHQEKELDQAGSIDFIHAGVRLTVELA